MPPDPLEGLKIFSRRCMAPKNFFRIDSPQQKILDRTLRKEPYLQALTLKQTGKL